MANLTHAVEEMYLVRDSYLRNHITRSVDEFLQSFADGTLDNVPVAEVQKEIERQVAGLAVQFAGYMLVSELNTAKDAQEERGLLSVLVDMFEAGNLGNYHLNVTTDPAAHKSFAPKLTFPSDVANALRDLVARAPEAGSTAYLDLMTRIESALEEYRAQTGL